MDNKVIITEDGQVVEVGDKVFNYYDMKEVTILEEPDHEGWFATRCESEQFTRSLNGERICTLEFATKKGWI
jgi:hypothetical protein